MKRYPVAAAILLPAPFPFEFPTSVDELITAVAERGTSRERFLLALQWAVIQNEKDTPLYVVIGTPMRGIRGGELRQHLTAWYVDPVIAWALKESLGKYVEDKEAQEFGEKIERLLLEWAKTATVNWCVVREDRPEIVTRRDHDSPLAWFSDRTVAVWGCGALGGHIAEYLTRAGIKKLILRDNGVVTPGILVRQPFDDIDIGNAKVGALGDRLNRIRPNLEVEVFRANILTNPLSNPDWVQGVDLIIDTTASAAVNSLLERRWCEGNRHRAPVISMAIAHDARRGMVTLSLPAHTGGPLDASRRLKLEACNQAQLSSYRDEFWPLERRQIFQPEPGCSDATFVGSGADVAGLAASMLNLAVRDLATSLGQSTATGHFVVQPHAGMREGLGTSFDWPADQFSEDIHAGYQVRISRDAWAGMRAHIERSRDEAGPEVETGGLLFGERDDAADVIWVTEVSGPPPDSTASALRFVCGVAGTAELNTEKRQRTRGAVQYIGMWHTHPDSIPLPSLTDRAGMRRLVAAAGGAGRVLLLIIGHPHDTPVLGTYLFRAQDFTRRGWPTMRACVIQVQGWG